MIFNMAWTKEKANETFGPIVYKSDKYVVRVKELDDGLHAFAHTLDADGAENLPLGYMLGHSSLWYDRKHERKKS